MKEETENKLIEEYNKTVKEINSEEYKSRTVKNNKFSEKFSTFFAFSMIPIVIFIFSMVFTKAFGNISAFANFIPIQILPSVIYGVL